MINQRITELKRNISLLEWDIPNIKNDELSSFKKRKLRQYRKELDRLMFGVNLSS